MIKKEYLKIDFYIICARMSNVIISLYFDNTADFHDDKETERKDELLEWLLMEELFCSSAVVLVYFINYII